MPEIPDHVPVYISSDFADDEPPVDKVGSAMTDPARLESKVTPPVSRESLLEDRPATTWQPYLPPQMRPDAPGEASARAADNESSAPYRASEAAATFKFSKRTTFLLMALTGVNLFAFGCWAGYYLIPREPVITSLKPSMANLFVESRPDKTPANLIADIATKANPSVVTIDIKFNSASSNSLKPGPSMIPPAEASGLIVRSDGYILTNSHVIHRNSDITVTLDDKRSFRARFIGRDDYSDLAVVKIDADKLPVLKFANSKTVQPGDWAIAIGSPLGFDHTLTLGVVSAINRSLADFKNRVDLIQHDAALNLGNSGGPLLNLNGEVIGINTAVRSQALCIGFATPSNVAADVASRLIASGQIPRPYLGVYMEDIDPDRTRSLTLPSHPVAVKIVRLASGGPAEKAGMAPGDLIVKIGGVAVRSRMEVRQLTQNKKPGDQVDFIVQRGTRTVPLKMTIGDLSKESPEF